MVISKSTVLLKFMAFNRQAANDDKTHILVSKWGESLRDPSFDINNTEKTIKQSTSKRLLRIGVSNNEIVNAPGKTEEKLFVCLYALCQMEQSISKSLLKKVAEGIFL